MCGICGIVLFDGRTVQPETIRSMTDSLAHRGPDASGCHFEPGIGLGHRRLSIIDLDSGHQPLSNEDESIWIVFNGEIYNYLELRAGLESKGHRFRTRSDTEVIVHLYEEVGEECFAQLRGMFAIALFDRKRKHALLARDRIGKKPLFYAYNGSCLVFGSELKAVVRSGYTATTIDPSAICDYFTFLYIPSPKSIYREVRKVPPAHYVVFSEGNARSQAYWDLSFGHTEDRSEHDWSERVRQALLEAVRVRLMSEVPLGSFLSGGVDSSAVVACMAQILDRPVTTCTVGFDEQLYSEVQHAQALAHHVRAEHHETMVQPSAAEVVEQLVWHYDEPFADSSAVPTYYVSKAAREHVTVALSGDGGDESFIGYRRYEREAADNRLRSMVPQAFRRTVLQPLAQWYPSFAGSSFGGSSLMTRSKGLLQRLARDPLEGYLARITVPASLRNNLLDGDIQQDLCGYDPLEQYREHYRRADSDDLLSRIQYLDIKTYLTDDICVKVDRASMAVSLEVRAPLLDHRLMELAARIPSSAKVGNGSGKHILKKAVEHMVPAGLMDRPKHGFSVPIAEWFRGPLREWAQDTLFSSDSWLNRKDLQILWSRHQQQLEDHSAILWAAFMFRQWQRIVDEQRATDPATHAGSFTRL
jgi:asparagine synthase (glutamine-hydrolysing)